MYGMCECLNYNITLTLIATLKLTRITSHPYSQTGATTTATTTTTTAVRYAIQHHTKQCTSGSMLATMDACKKAKAVLDPGAEGGVKDEPYAGAPSG